MDDDAFDDQSYADFCERRDQLPNWSAITLDLGVDGEDKYCIQIVREEVE